MENAEWFEDFDALVDPLTKSLILVALIQAQGLVSLKESLLMKRFLMQSLDDQTKCSSIVDAFMREKSLYKLRSTFRGSMGLPRMQSVDRQ